MLFSVASVFRNMEIVNFTGFNKKRKNGLRQVFIAYAGDGIVNQQL